MWVMLSPLVTKTGVNSMFCPMKEWIAFLPFYISFVISTHKGTRREKIYAYDLHMECRMHVFDKNPPRLLFKYIP